MSTLNTGRAIEQWLPHVVQSDYGVLRWVSIDKEKNDDFSVSYFEVFDEGDFLDVYEFSAIDPDTPLGTITSFDDFEAALSFSQTEYNCLEDHFVSRGMIQEEYLKYLKSNK